MTPEPSISPAPRPSRRRIVLLLAGAGAAAALVALAVNYRPVVSRVVTHLAFRDAEKVSVEILALPGGQAQHEIAESAVKGLAARYGGWFEKGFIDRETFLQKCPPNFELARLIPPVLVLQAYLGARHERLQFVSRATVIEDAALAEAKEWLDVAFHLTAPKEMLANFFTRDLVLEASGKKEEWGGFFKIGAFLWLLAEPDHPLVQIRPDAGMVRLRGRVADGLTRSSWDAVLRDCDHPREKVRAGALILLHRHPERDLATGRMRRALADPSEWVRLAAAGCLALRGEGAGEATLLAGLDHERWELRFWAAYGLVRLGKPAYLEPVRRRHEVETDAWLQGVLGAALKLLGAPP